MDEGIQAAGSRVGVTEKDVQALQRRRLIKVALFGAVPVVTFFAGYLLRKVLQQETSTELPSTYPYAVAAALIRPATTSSPYDISKKYTTVGMLSFAAVAFTVGYFIPDITVERDQPALMYGVFSR